MVLVSVSMGAPFVHAFLHWIEETLGTRSGRAWKTKYLERWVSSSGVFAGVAQLAVGTIQPDKTVIFPLRGNRVFSLTFVGKNWCQSIMMSHALFKVIKH